MDHIQLARGDNSGQVTPTPIYVQLSSYFFKVSTNFSPPWEPFVFELSLEKPKWLPHYRSPYTLVE